MSPFRVLSLLLLLNCCCAQSAKNKSKNDDVSRPNFVVFLADDLGFGDVGCFGNDTVATPNIDRLCREGTKLTHLLADASVCTPSRASFLTGRHANRMGLAGAPGGPLVVMYTAGRAGLPEEEITWAEVLQRRGYDTMAIGKWHLGWDGSWKGDQAHGPLTHGFNAFFGLPFTLVDGFEIESPFLTYSGYVERDHPLHRHGVAAALAFLVVCAVYSENFGYSILVSLIIIFCLSWFFLEHFRLHRDSGWWQRSLFMERFLNSQLMDGKRVVEQPIKLPELGPKLLGRALEFLRSKNGSDDPFALYYAFPEVHTPLRPNKQFRGKSQHGRYGDSILEMDDAIGQVLNELDALGVADNTFVLFASDHGSHVDKGSDGGSNGPFSGGKGIAASEGGLRVPGVVRWPNGNIAKGKEISAPASLLDILPTFADIVGEKLDADVTIDGKSLLPLLQGQTDSSSHRILRHYCGTSLHAVRIIKEDGGVYKGYFRRPVLNSDGHCGFDAICPCHEEEGGVERFERPMVFDLNRDPGEKKPMETDKELYRTLEAAMTQEFSNAESESSSLPPSQLNDPWLLMPAPWLQPCARLFSFCRTS